MGEGDWYDMQQRSFNSRHPTETFVDEVVYHPAEIQKKVIETAENKQLSSSLFY